MSRNSVILFDIDGTLVRCGGAGGSALQAAFLQEFDIAEMGPIELGGRTDLGIFNELLSRHGLSACETNHQRLSRRYFSLLPEHLSQRLAESQARVLPGVFQLLDTLRNTTQHTLGLMTGNLPTSAQIKLDHFSLWDYFEFGIFGDLADHRPLLAQPALARIAEHCGGLVAGDSIVIIGDTPLDVELSKAMRARSLAVCTGGFDHHTLTAGGADLVADDLSNVPAILEWIDTRWSQSA